MEVISGAIQVARVTPLEGAGNISLHPVDGANCNSPHEPLIRQPFDRIEVELLSPTYLYSQRIVAFHSGNYMTRCYDVLRNQIIDEKKDKPVHLIAVTAPTSGCGVTVTAINLALSFARVHGANVLLVDANIRSSAIGRLLGLPSMSRYEELTGSLTSLEVNGTHLHLLVPASQHAMAPIRVDAARLMSEIELARQRLMPTVVIYDMPPILVGDELNAIVNEADTAVVVLAVGHSKRADFEVCKTFLGSREGIRVVLNRSRRHGL